MALSRRDLLLVAGASALTKAVGSPASKIIENEWIRMPDGIRLAARIFLPESAASKPVGAILEYIPYRKRDIQRRSDERNGAILNQAGFAYVRVDIRGSGDSAGVMTVEYGAPERRDAIDVIRWISKQAWCNGAAGMRGISWGAISALQAAAAAPPELKAIVAACGTESSYIEDAHYMGGCLMLENVQWGVIFKNVMVAPPDPEIAGPRWRDMWLERLHATGPDITNYTQHQTLDDFWKQIALTDFGKIQCPVYVADGTTDPYVNTVDRLLSRLRVPRKGIIGPWGHRYPTGDPGPGLDWFAEECRWWDRWLNGRENGIMQEPMLRSYITYAAPAEQYPKDTPGRWVADPAWPSPHVKEQQFFLNSDGLSRSAGPKTRMRYESVQTVGLATRYWCPTNMALHLPGEQSDDDAKSLRFDGAPLRAPLEILGIPVLRARLRSNAEVAKLVVRLTEVTPEGKSWLISYGLLNLTHRASDEHPSPLEPGKDYDVDVPLYLAAHRFRAGNRIRVAISETLWPLLWPSPTQVTLEITTGTSVLNLPVRDASVPDPEMPIAVRRDQYVADYRPSDGPNIGVFISGAYEMVHVIQNSPGFQAKLPELGVAITQGSNFALLVNPRDPNNGSWSLSNVLKLEREGSSIETTADAKMTSTEKNFTIAESIKATENGQVVFEKEWKTDVPRRLV
jgi:predicted acyl esterase